MVNSLVLIVELLISDIVFPARLLTSKEPAPVKLPSLLVVPEAPATRSKTKVSFSAVVCTIPLLMVEPEILAVKSFSTLAIPTAMPAAPLPLVAAIAIEPLTIVLPPASPVLPKAVVMAPV